MIGMKITSIKSNNNINEIRNNYNNPEKPKKEEDLYLEEEYPKIISFIFYEKNEIVYACPRGILKMETQNSKCNFSNY